MLFDPRAYARGYILTPLRGWNDMATFLRRSAAGMTMKKVYWLVLLVTLLNWVDPAYSADFVKSIRPDAEAQNSGLTTQGSKSR